VVAFLSLACTPMPFLFYKYGEKLRKNSNYAPSQPTISNITGEKTPISGEEQVIPRMNKQEEA